MIILILEDNQSDIDLLLRELDKNGILYTPRVAKTRQAYLDALTDPYPDIILSDFSLPAFDGLEAFNIKQSTCPDVPFIIISGAVGEETAVEMIKNGVTDYTLKDKLFTITPKIHRALNEVSEMAEKRRINEELVIQNKRLHEIAFLQSHQVRVPIVQMLGLFRVLNLEDPGDPVNVEIMQMLQRVGESLDQVIIEITQKTSRIKQEIH
ncbi:response regulator [Daejeonella sp.]|uniref:response regulator n=1 Tax=Daejeonella sp. TaxID=2805397 RepID=UPI0030C33DBF